VCSSDLIFFVCIFLFFISGIAIIGFFFISNFKNPPAEIVRNKDGKGDYNSDGDNLLGRTFPKKNFNILILGTDKNWTEDDIMYTKDVRTDTIMVASLDLEKQTAGLLSIPRDSYVSIPSEYDYDIYTDQSDEISEEELHEPYRGGYEGKINGAYTDGGVELTKRAVEEVLQINIDYYVIVKVNALPDLIDAIGGIEVCVEKNMDYDDNWGHLHIHLKEGWQTLDGNRAEEYSRFRNDEEGDLGRIRRQQQVIYAVKNKVTETKSFAQIKNIIEAAYKNVETDLTPFQICDLAGIYRDVERSDVKMATIPTYSNSSVEVSYQIIDSYLLPDYVNEYLLGMPPPITVEIVNGNGRDYLSYQLEEYLLSLGFKVIDVRTDSYSYETSQIIVHSERVKATSLVPVVRMLGEPEISNDGTEELVDLTIILGADYSLDYNRQSLN